jgi:hypothetical protein
MALQVHKHGAETMRNLNRYLEQMIESKKGCALISKTRFDSREFTFSKLSESEQAELIKLAILEDKDTRADLLSNLEHLLENALERYEEQEEAEKGQQYQYWKEWAIFTQLI